MHKNDLVVGIKVDNKVLREQKDAVELPFGSEYSLFIKNLKARKAVLDIDIDGRRVSGDGQLLIQPNSTIELNGFVEGDAILNKFKFIEKTKQIENHRGNKVDDGLIRVEFKFEKEKAEQKDVNVNTTYTYDYEYKPRSRPYWGDAFDGIYGPIYSSGAPIGHSSYHISSSCCMSNLHEKAVSKSFKRNVEVSDGITVKGSCVHEQLGVGTIGELEKNAHVIVLKLKGFNEKKTLKAVTKSTHAWIRQCSTCGGLSKPEDNYCGNCGTYLERRK